MTPLARNKSIATASAINVGTLTLLDGIDGDIRPR
jgi:hypothetical protein